MRRNPSHFHAYLLVCLAPAAQRPDNRFQHNFVTTSLFQHQPSETSRRVAACFRVASIYVDDAHKGVGATGSALGRGRFNDQKLITADADGHIANLNGFLDRRPVGSFSAIDDDKVILQALHLHKFPS